MLSALQCGRTRNARQALLMLSDNATIREASENPPMTAFGSPAELTATIQSGQSGANARNAVVI
jgi:hypothetical protein